MVQQDVGRVGDEAAMSKARQWVSNFNVLAMLVFFLISFSSWNNYSTVERNADKYFATVQGVADDLKAITPYLSDSQKAEFAKKLAPTANGLSARLEQAKQSAAKAHGIAVAATTVTVILCAMWLFSYINAFAAASTVLILLIAMAVGDFSVLLSQVPHVSYVNSAEAIVQIGLTVAGYFSLKQGIAWRRAKRALKTSAA